MCVYCGNCPSIFGKSLIFNFIFHIFLSNCLTQFYEYLINYYFQLQKSSIICDMNSRFLGGPALSHRRRVKGKKGLFESSTGKATSFLIFTRPHRQSKRELLTLWIYILFFHAFKKLQFLIFIRRLSFFQLFINGQFFHRTKVLVYISLFTSNNNTKKKRETA